MTGRLKRIKIHDVPGNVLFSGQDRLYNDKHLVGQSAGGMVGGWVGMGGRLGDWRNG